MNTVIAIVRANLKRLFAQRSNLFFLVALPLLIVFALGVAIGGTTETRIGVVDPHPTAASRAVAHRMAGLEDVSLVTVDSASDLRDDVARLTLDAGWVVTEVGDRTEYRWFSSGQGSSLSLQSVFPSAVEEASVRQRVVSVVAQDTGASPQAAGDAVESAAAATPAVTVKVTQVSTGGTVPATIRAVLAAGELTLFIFLTSLTGAAYLLTTRQLGVTRRIRAGPVPVSQIIVGEALGRFVIALGQAAIVFFGSMLLFGVDWRAPVAVGLLCVAMSLVGTGAAMLLGAAGRSEQQVGALALLLSLALGALGGSMQPLEFFPDTLRKVAFVTPHAWMNDALWRILVDGAGLAQVWPAVAVLSGAGVLLLGLASYVLGRSLR